MKMKTTRFTLISIVVLSILIGQSNSVLARTNASIGVGVGFRGFYGGYRAGPYGYPHNYRYWGPGWGWRYNYPYGRTIIVSGGYCYDWGPDYYVADQPVIESAPVVVENQTDVGSINSPQVVQPKQIDKETQALLKTLRYKRGVLLKQLETGDKEQRMQAIKELAGFSFDDNVRQSLEKVLLSDPDPELRTEVVHAFGEVKNVKALTALKKARVEDADVNVRKAADQAIKNMGSH
jgi:hypothetical protein